MKTNLRTFSGFLMIIFLLPIFITLVLFTTTETSRVQSFNEVLDKKIDTDETKLTQTSFIKDGSGKVISEIRQPMNRIYLPSDKIPDFLKDLLVVSEDQNFYDHKGFDLSAIARALAVNIHSNGIEQGASTITQQLARNLYLNHDKTYNRKLSELLYSYQLERSFSKDEILELYINAIYFQNGAYGIEAASQHYFQKSTNKLSKAELAFLASIPNNPSFYDPIKHFKRTKDRQERLVDLLTDKGYLHHEEGKNIKKQPITLFVKDRVDLYPDYVTYVESELSDLIAQEEGLDKQIEKAVGKEKVRLEEKLSNKVSEAVGSGIIIHTAMDSSVQERTKNAINRFLPYGDIEGSASVVDHESQEVIALVGGKNYKKYDFHRGFQAYRQPGSSIKPLLVYAPYLDQTGADLRDTISADSFCERGYCPQNYGGGTYGMVSLERAFIHSYNTPAVRLLSKTGVDKAFSYLDKFNFKRVTAKDHVLASAVGGFTHGMTPLELTGAYTTFANQGYYLPPRAIRKVTDLNGKVLYRWQDKQVKVWSHQTVDKVRYLMKRTVAAGTAKKAYFSSAYVGGKTGTTNDYKDYWFVGLTEDVTAGVWVGKDNPASIQAIESASPQLLIWKEIVSGY